MDNDTYITFEKASEVFPGKPSHRSVWEWARHGLRVVNSPTRLHLKHARQGVRLYTTVAWINEFMVALAQADAIRFDQDDDAGRRRVPGKREAEIRQTEHRMKARKASASSRRAASVHMKGANQHV